MQKIFMYLFNRYKAIFRFISLHYSYPYWNILSVKSIMQKIFEQFYFTEL